ncbi:MAG TPA: YeeE/YedE family protein [Pseudomonadota bacterium]|jgi:uncharacterized membrane protein YedE/YeeE|nr:YeeE/YedE family protein [Pseudomonadota bacterium]HNK46428.1 YeeE/YedE family protein [Pseudomonadota bacterium]HNN51354.1 YeeE/YedE family protein [Pseudomonadota bacterium]HNO68845.1 YeeE/YedE family protein [Pseudomonadota bacterium]
MTTKRGVTSLLLGFLFGTGLLVSGMTNPQKVQDFLDFTGTWDPSLSLVLGGALLVSLISFPLIVKREKPVLGQKFHLPTAKDIDAKLVIGAALFGTGWGLSGFCPGPAMVSLSTGSTSAMIFVVAMLLGMALHRTYHDLRSPSQ